MTDLSQTAGPVGGAKASSLVVAFYSALLAPFVWPHRC